MTAGWFWICFNLIVAVGFLPTGHSFCFKTYKVRSDNTYKCRNRVNDDRGSFEYCCSLNDAAGYSANYKGWNCQICQSALPEEELTPVWSEWGEWSVCSRTCDWGLRSRTRNCVQGICDGVTVDQEQCIEVHNCPVDGNWGSWGVWTSCSKTCGVGIRSRSRECNNPPPQHNGRTCLVIGGDSVEQENCVEVQNCPINGNWGNWQPYFPCPATCGRSAVRTRERICDNPPPQYGGLECEGANTETTNCGLQPCPIDGKWGNWSPWTGCSRTCGNGKSTRKRNCNRPKPKYNGKPCTGDDTERKTCNKGKCVEIVDWTNWSKWSSCKDCSEYHEQRRTRDCPVKLDTRTIKCEGSAIEYHKCTSEADCIGDEEANGSGDGCTGDNCCDDADGCPDLELESDSFSFPTTNEPTTQLPTKCRQVVNKVAGPAAGKEKEDDGSGSSSISSDSQNQASNNNGEEQDSSDSVSTSEGSNSDESTKNEASFIWVDCPEVTVPVTPTCDKSWCWDYSDSSSDEDSGVSSKFESEESSKQSPVIDDRNDDTDYESSLKVKNGGGSAGVGGASDGSFSDL